MGNAFYRSRKIFELVAQAKSIIDSELRKLALSAIPEYRSRGKGLRRREMSDCQPSSTRLPKIGNTYPEAKARRIASAKAYNERLRNAKSA